MIQVSERQTRTRTSQSRPHRGETAYGYNQKGKTNGRQPADWPDAEVISGDLRGPQVGPGHANVLPPGIRARLASVTGSGQAGSPRAGTGAGIDPARPITPQRPLSLGLALAPPRC
jgi:hypothetical protein